jgi:DNA (cytosine-5)-methyltransferase 1
VDIITFGSPCQDLSIAGKRIGWMVTVRAVFRSRRIVKEMREKTHGEKPRFIVWGKRAGGLLLQQREDFKAVLEESFRIKEPEVPPLPPPEKGQMALRRLLPGRRMEHGIPRS